MTQHGAHVASSAARAVAQRVAQAELLRKRSESGRRALRRAEQPLPPRLATGGLDAEMMTAEASDTPLLPAASAPPRFRNAVAGDAVLVEPRPMVRARESLLHARLALPVEPSEAAL